MPVNSFQYSRWLNDFLVRRGLDAPDQRALFAYQCSQKEYEGLRDQLQALEALTAGTCGNRAVSACFVLFCAEWYRRDYRRRDGWSWDPIYQMLGFRLGAQDLSKVIPKGLEGYWGRPIHVYESERRDFLGSVFSEGGLPFQMLRSVDSRFNALFKQLLKQYDQGQLMGFSTLQQVQRRLEHTNLPQVFNSPISIDLIASMVDQLVHLVADYSLDQSQEPVETLDRLYPKWRETFPLPLDENTGSALLNSLLATATDERKKQQSTIDKLLCEHFWNNGSPDRVKVHISLPETLHFPLNEQPSTARFNLVIVGEDNILAELSPGYAQIGEKLATVKPRQRKVIATRHDITIPLRLAAMVGGATISSISIPDSAIALGDAPVGFERVDENWRLAGQASFTTRERDVLLVLPEGGTYEAEDPEAISLVAATLAPFGLPSIRIKGATEIRVQGQETFRVRTGRDGAGHAKITLIGDESEWPTKPALTFVGLPQVRWAQGVQPEDGGCDLFVSGKRPVNDHPQEMLGTQFVSIRNRNGDSLLRRKIGILPPDFRLQMQSGVEPGTGSIFVLTKSKCLLQVLNDEYLNVKQVRHEHSVEIQLKSRGVISSQIHLSVTPNLLVTPIEFLLPFPGFGCVAHDRTGEPLAKELSVDDLLGARLHLLGQRGRATTFILDLTLRGRNARKIYHRWSYRVSDRPTQIELFNLRDQIIDLFSLYSGIDQTVRIQILMNGTQLAWHDIRRYRSVAKLNVAERFVEFDHASDDVHPVLITLPNPGRRPTELIERTSAGVTTGVFDLAATPDNDGPWLIIPSRSDTTSFRPLIIPSDRPPIEDRTTVRTLEKAAANVDFELPARGFAAVFDLMVDNLKHSGWDFLKAQRVNYSHLSLATFEAWKALVGHHSAALSMSLFKFEMDPEYVGRIEREFPFLWEFFPINKVLDAAFTFERSLADMGVSAEAIGGLMERMFERFKTVTPAFAASVQEMHYDTRQGRTSPVPPSSILDSWYKDLIRHRSEAQWSEFGSRRLSEWHGNFQLPILTFQPAHLHHRATVFFPMFAAAVASGRVQLSTVFDDRAEAIFLLRRARDFDTQWFESVYRYSLATIASQGA